jgi:hypothetical protein
MTRTLSRHHTETAPERGMIEPRGLSREQAASYAGCRTLSSFSDRIRRGILPGPIPGTTTWDKRAIDAALDRASGLQATIAPSPLQEWKANRARRAQGHTSGTQDARERED